MEGILCIIGAVTGAWYKLAVLQPIGALAYPQQSFYANLQAPEDGGSFNLASLTSIIHQVDLRSLRGPCFVSGV